uniref:Uncharacterized protein n=1 Tax=Strigamia maritima TaxID=126957 RepID=T1JBS6_STRMM
MKEISRMARADTLRASMGYSFKDSNVFMLKVFCYTKCHDRLLTPHQRVQVNWDKNENLCVCTLDEPPAGDIK